MPNHYIHFNRRQVRLDPHRKRDCEPQAQPESGPERQDEQPWYAIKQDGDAGFERPMYHVTRAETASAAAIRPGDTIWLIGQLYTPWGKLPAALDARFDVACVDRRKETKGFHYTAAESSRWFPCADVSRVLFSLTSKTASGRATPLVGDPDKPVGYYLRQLRRLVSAAGLQEWERKLDEAPKHFVSYRHVDGTRLAYEFIASLLTDGKVVYWDRWSLPRRLAERREHVTKQALDQRITDLIDKARTVWGIETPCYAVEGSYSLQEKELSLRLGKYRPAVLFPGTERNP
ncbi:MAG: hypothetical protein P8Z31_03830 [Gammaproteobacteria bacterium]